MRKSLHPVRRPLASSLAKMSSAAAICAALAIASGSTANAATYFWDSDGAAAGNDILTGTGLGGAGTWTIPTSGAPTSLWYDATAQNHVVWPNTNPNADTAVFTGTGGAVALGGAVFVNSLQFNSTGYSITNGGTAANTLTLSGANPTVNVLTGGHNATISAVIAGNQGLIKTGAGTLTLGTTGNTFTGDVQIQGGTLTFTGQGNADQTAFGPGAKKIILTNNATLALVGTSSDPNVAGGKGFVIGTGGGTIDVAPNLTFSLNDGTANGSAQNQLQGAGTLTKTGTGILKVDRDFSSTFSGNVNVNQGRLDIGAANAVGNVGTITVDGGGVIGTARLNINSTGGVGLTNNVVLQNGGVLSTTGASHNIVNSKSLTIGAGISRIRADDGAADTSSTTNRTFVINGALKGAGTVQVTGPGPTGNRGVVAFSNAASDFSGTIIIDKNVSVENFARWDGTTASNTGKTLGTALIKFESLGGNTSNDGQLDLRDNGTGNNQVFNYGNNVDMTSTGGTIVVGGDTQATIKSTGGRFVLGSLALGGGNTLTVNNTPNAYSLEFSGATTLGGDAIITNTANLTLTGGIVNGAKLTKNGAGVLTVGSHGGTTYSGDTIINAGGIVFNSASAIGGSGESVTLASGAFIGANFAANQANLIDRIKGNTNTSVIALGQDTSSALDLTKLSNARLGAVGTVTYTGTLTQAGNTTLLGGGGGTLILPGTNVVSGNRNLDVGTYGTPAGVVAIDEAQTFTGAITLSGGQLLRIGSNASLGNAANEITSSGGGIQFKDAASGFDIFTTRTIKFTNGFILDTNGYNYTPTVAVGNTGATGDFTKAGAGKLTLTTPVKYDGKTIITGGTLSIGADNILGAAPATTSADRLQIQSGGALEATATFTIPSQRGITLSNGGGTISVTDANTLTVASSTSGTGALIKEGTGTLILTADPNHSGGFTINGGVLTLQHTGSTDGSVVINNGGTLRIVSANVLGDGHNVIVNTGGVFDLRESDQISQLLGTGTVLNNSTTNRTLTLSSTVNATFDGTINNGTATVGITKSNSNVVTFTGTNGYTGNTSINTGQLRVEGATARLSNGGTVIVGDNSGNDESLVLGLNTDVVTGEFDKIGNTSELEFRGSTTVTLNGPAVGSTAFAETVGNIDFRDGVGMLTLNPAAGGQVELNAGTIIREGGTGAGVIRGTNLGGTGADSSRVFLNSTTGLLVGSGGTGSQSSIIPFVIGGANITAAPNTFFTYNATSGLTLLEASDYEATIAGSTGRNVSVAGNEVVTADASINALRVTGGTTTLTDADLTIDSGAILFTGTGSIEGSGAIDSGARQLIILSSSDTSLTGTVNVDLNTGAGLSIGDAGNAGHTIVLGGDNRIAGGVTINGGTVRAASATAIGQQGALLNDLVLKAGNNAVGGALSSAFQLGGNSFSVVFNGNDRLQGSTRIQNASSTASTLTIVTNVNSDSNDGVLEDGTGGGALSLVKRGAARLILEGTNSYTGSTEILAGTVQLNGANGRLSGTSGITLAGGSILNLNNTSGANQGDRLNNNAAITMRGAQLQFDNNQGSADYSETAGALNSTSGSNQIVTDFAASGRPSTLTFASLNVSAGSALNFTNFATVGDVAIGEGGTRNRVIFTTDPTATNGIIGGNVYYTKNFEAGTAFDPVDFASYDFDTDAGGADVENGIVVFNAYNIGAEDTWTNTSVVRPAASATLSANRDVRALKLDNGINLTIGAGQTLNVTSGGIIYNPNSTTAATSTIAEGKLTAGGAAAGELAVRVDSNLNAATLVISSEIANNTTGAVSLLKSGPDTLTLSGTNTYSGRTTIAEGTVNISADANLGAAPAAATASHLRLYGGTLNLTAGTVTLSENRGLELAGGINTISAASGANLVYNTSIANSPEGGLTVNGNVDMALSGPTVLGRSLRVTGSGTTADAAAIVLSGNANSIGESLQVGVDAPGAATLTYGVAGGSLVVGAKNPNGSNLDIGVRTNNTGVSTLTSGTVDLTGTNSFIARVDRMRLGVVTADNNPDAPVKGVLLLSTNADIQALTEVTVGDSPHEGLNGQTNVISFGSGVNSVTTPIMTVGGRKAEGRIDLATGGSLNLQGFVPGSLDLRIAYNNQDGTGVTAIGVTDFTGGTLVADLDEVVVGFKNGAGAGTGGATGSILLGEGNNNVVANQIRLGDYSGGSSGTASGTLEIAGGSLLVKNNVSLGLYTGAGTTGGASGTLRISGGSVRIDGNIVTSDSARSASTLNLVGGTLDMSGGTIDVDTFNAQSGALRNVNQIFNGDGSTPAALTKTGTGTLELQGANTYTGGTNVNEGTLVVNGSITGTVTTSANTTLGGNGSINGAVDIASLGTLSPGSTLGKLDINGGLTLGNNSTLKIELNGLTPGSGYDQVNMTSSTGSVSLGTNVTLSLTLGFTPNTTIDTFYYILTRSDSGASFGNLFAGLAEGAKIDLGNGVIGTLTYFANWTGDAATSSFTGGNDVAIAVPEPGTLTTLIGGIGALVGLGRFRRRHARA